MYNKVIEEKKVERKDTKTRKMFYEDLPKWGKGGLGKEGTINWKESIGYMVKFICEGIQGEIEIIDAIRKNGTLKLMIRYMDKEKWISTSNFKNCGIGGIIGTKSSDYKYEIGDVVKTNSGAIRILEQIRIEHSASRKNLEKGYRYECLNDGYTSELEEYGLTSGIGCPVCSNKKVIKGINDIATTHPHLIIKTRPVPCPERRS